MSRKAVENKNILHIRTKHRVAGLGGESHQSFNTGGERQLSLILV